MISDYLFLGFCTNRNIKDSTIKSYRSAILKYESFHKMAMDDLIGEAIKEDESLIPLKNRCIKRRLLDFRAFLLDSDLSISTVRTYFSRIKTFYRHFEIELPYLNDIRRDGEYLSSYDDLPTKSDIRRACDISSLDFIAVILFISSSGCAKAETLSLTVGDFIKATEDYHDGGSFDDILHSLENRRDVVPTFYLKRIKTNKFYHTFCSPEASHCIVEYLLSRENLTLEDKLFDFTDSSLIYHFKKVNDKLDINDCNAGSVYKLSKALGVTMEQLVTQLDFLTGTEGEYLGIKYKWTKDDEDHQLLILIDGELAENRIR